jgi:putative endonuclease
MTASKPRGVIYTGMSSDLTKRYWVDRLVYFEAQETVEAAQRREFFLKRWRRDWKIELIETMSPT